MQKITSLLKRDYEGTRLVYDEVVPGAEWAAAGEGVATAKIDGTSCLIRAGKLFKRYDRKLTGEAAKRKKKGYDGPWNLADYKAAPEGWEAAEAEADPITGHWPGWQPVSDTPEDQWHREAFDSSDSLLPDGTYELVGPKVQGNPYGMGHHQLRRHGSEVVDAPRTYDELKVWFSEHVVEGIVWHHSNGRMVKLKRKDFGYRWPE